MTTAMKKKIKDISLPAACSIRQAMRAIDQGALGLALLIDPETERFVALVTDGDIRRALLNGYGLDSPVAKVPRPNPKTASAEMSIEEVAGMFSDMVRVIPLLNDEGHVEDLAVFDRRLRLPVAQPSFDERELLYVSECILTGWVSSKGKFVTRFEEMFADFCDARYAIATSNGTTALHIALLALGIGPGDEVIVPTLTFIATANAVTYTGAKPVFVDSERETWNIDPALIEEAITPLTKAIVPVHLYGHPANMDPILEIADHYNLAVIEDAAEAHGARYKGRRVGCLGDLGIFSFYGNKIITTGEGGMVVTNEASLADKLRMLRDHGMSPDKRYWHPILGYNYRMTNVQAAIGVAQLEKINLFLAAKDNIAKSYAKKLRNVSGLTLPPSMPWAENVHWLYSILLDETTFGMSRDSLMEALTDQGIETRPLFYPVHIQPVYETGQHLPVAERLAWMGLSLPSAMSLSPEDIGRIANAILSARQKSNMVAV